MGFRTLSDHEHKAVLDYFSELGVSPEEAGSRLALLELVAESEERPMFDVHIQLSGSDYKYE